MTSTSCTYDALTKNTFTRDGYTFAGWSTTATGSVEYTDGQNVKNLTDEQNGEVTLYAVWTANLYTVVFHKNIGDGTTSSVQFTYDQEELFYYF